MSGGLRLGVLAALGSAGLLAAALWFQHVAGMPPCALCIWQRWPHGAAIALGALLVLTGWRLAALGGAGAMLAGAGIGLYHAGVEQGWWQGPAACSAQDISGLSTEDLMARIMAAPIVRCDEIPWELLGISMAGWNALLSLALGGVWIAAAVARHGRRPAR